MSEAPRDPDAAHLHTLAGEYETKADGWQGPVSLGLVKPGQSLRIALDKLPPLQANQLFDLTLENAGGSTVGKPTGPVQFIGRAVKLGQAL
jgi:anti-sigma-K factor RskA